MSLSTVGFFFFFKYIFESLKYCCPSVQLSNTAKLWPILENLSNTVVRFFLQRKLLVNKYYYSIAFYLQNLQGLLKLSDIYIGMKDAWKYTYNFKETKNEKHST